MRKGWVGLAHNMPKIRRKFDYVQKLSIDWLSPIGRASLNLHDHHIYLVRLLLY